MCLLGVRRELPLPATRTPKSQHILGAVIEKNRPPASGVPRKPDAQAFLAHGCERDLQILSIQAGHGSSVRECGLTEVRAALPTRRRARTLGCWRGKVRIRQRGDGSRRAARDG